MLARVQCWSFLLRQREPLALGVEGGSVKPERVICWAVLLKPERVICWSFLLSQGEPLALGVEGGFG